MGCYTESGYIACSRCSSKYSCPQSDYIGGDSPRDRGW